MGSSGGTNVSPALARVGKPNSAPRPGPWALPGRALRDGHLFDSPRGPGADALRGTKLAFTPDQHRDD